MYRTINALNSVYPGKMSVFEYTKVKNNNSYSLKKTLTFDNIPCFLTSMVSNRSTARDSAGGFVNKISQAKKVFLPANYIIKTGSYIEISQYGRTFSFEYSGESFVYCSHQEIILENQNIT